MIAPGFALASLGWLLQEPTTEPQATESKPVEIQVEFVAKPAGAFAGARVVSIEEIPKLWTLERRNVDDEGMGVVSAYGRLLVMSAPWSGARRQGRVLVYAVRDGSLVRAWSGEREDACFGIGLDASRDLDGDGVLDVVVGAPANEQTHAAPSAVYVFSGATGNAMLRISAPMTNREPWDVDYFSCERPLPHNFSRPISDAFGWAVATGDFDGDGLADLAIGFPQRGPNDCVGVVYAISGATLRELMRPREAEKK